MTGLTNEVAHTFELRAANASGEGAAAQAGPVTPTPGICGRTQQVQGEILLRLSGVSDCAAVTVADLAGLVSLEMASQNIASLKSGDFAGLTSVIYLDLRSNSFTTLPPDVFSGLTALRTLDLSGNPTNPLPLTVTVEKVGTDQVRAKVLAGAPFAVDIPVTVANGALAGGASALGVAAGSVESTPVTVARTAGTTAAVTVDVNLSTPPTLPTDHSGYTFVKSTSGLPATILPDAANVAPSFTSSATFNPAENQTTVGTVQASDDDTGDNITGYALSGGADQALFAIDGTSGALVFQTAPNYEDPQDTDTDNAYLVEVQATSGTGDRVQTTTQTITVMVMDADEGQSGTVTIDGTAPMVGDALTASTANVADPDGLPDPFEPTWQWYHTPAGGAEAVISGATSATYTVVEADLGAALTAKASWTDVGGFANTLASAPTAAVTRAAATPAAPTGFTAMVGNAQVTLGWDAPAPDSGVTRHDYRYKTTGSYPATWTRIATSAPGEANEAGFTVTGLTNEVAHTFELRAANASGEGAAAQAGPVTPTPGIWPRPGRWAARPGRWAWRRVRWAAGPGRTAGSTGADCCGWASAAATC